MRVALHVGQLLAPVPGGIGRYVRGLLGALPAAGVDVVPFAAGSVPDGVGSRDYVDLGFPHGSWRYEAWHRLRRLGLPVDAPVVHGPSLAVPPAGRRALVVTVHDLVFRRYPETLTRRGVAFHRRGLALARREAAAIVVPSAFTRDELLGEGFDAGTVHVIPHGVSAPPPPPDADVDERLHRLGVSAPFVLAVGTVEPRKGLPTVTAAVAAVRRHDPELTLVVAGRRGWGDVVLDGAHVREVGSVDEAALDALYRRALLLAAASRYEGFGMPLLEAMARGCPVVASDIGSHAEVAGDAGVLVAPDDAEAWAATLAALLGDPDRRAALGERGRRRAASFTWAIAAERHAAVYASVGPHGHP